MMRAAHLVALVLLVASPALAGGEADLYGTYVSFDQAEESFGAGVRVGWVLSGGLSADFAVTFLENGELTPTTGYTGDLQVTPLELGLKYALPNGFYVGGGVSYLLFETDNFDIDEETGYYGRIGYQRVGPSGWGWFVEGIYRDFDADVGVVVDMSGPGFSAGATVKW